MKKHFNPLSKKYCTKINDFFRQTSNLMVYYIMQHMLNDFRFTAHIISSFSIDYLKVEYIKIAQFYKAKKIHIH